MSFDFVLATANMLICTLSNGVPFGMIVLNSVNCYQIDNLGILYVRISLLACLRKKRFTGLRSGKELFNFLSEFHH